MFNLNFALDSNCHLIQMEHHILGKVSKLFPGNKMEIDQNIAAPPPVKLKKLGKVGNIK